MSTNARTGHEELGYREFKRHREPSYCCMKQAERIVGECIGCCEQVISDPVPESVDTFEQGGIHCIDEIRQHFGIGMSTEDKKTLIKELLGVKND
jgi:hypothetical protein